MVIKNLHNKTKINKRALPSLDAYLQQAQSYRRNGSIKKGKQMLRKAALASVIPLAAISTANGQCMIGLTQKNTFGMTHSFYYILNTSGMCSNTMLNNAMAFPAPGAPMTTVFLVATAMTNASMASAGWSCSCGGMSSTFLFDCNDGFGAACPLPVELVYFDAKTDLNSIVLKWETATEVNNSGFEILRSTDGYFYNKIGWLAGNGNSQESKQYQFVDKDIRPNKIYYYRLNQLDYDGTNDYSPVVTTMITDETIIEVGEVFPNPVGGNFARIEINTPVEAEARMLLFDARGALMSEGETYLKEGTNYLKIDVKDLIPGTYFAKVQVGQEWWYRKIWVQ